MRVIPLLLATLVIALVASEATPVQEPAVDTAEPVEAVAEAPAVAEGAEVLAVTVRPLRDGVVAVSDDGGGWRLEHFAETDALLSVEDPLGPVVEITRDGRGRPLGLLVGTVLGLEYSYSYDSDRWVRKTLSDLRNGEVLLHLTRAQNGAEWHQAAASEGPCVQVEAGGSRITCSNGRRYAAVPAGAGGTVVRSVVIDGQDNWWLGDRVDYTDEQLVLHLSNGTPQLSVAVAVTRDHDSVAVPTVVAVGEPTMARHAAVSSSARSARRPTAAEPSLMANLPSAVESVVRDAYPIAVDRVRWTPECRALFEELAVSGNGRLQSSLYAPPGGGHSDDPCAAGALAYTHVGSPITHLCARFAGLSPEEAAVVLIHEALHYAGMVESPLVRAAPTSAEIHTLVREACGF